MKKLFALTLALVAFSAHAKPPVVWDASCSLGILNLATGTCLGGGASVSWGNVTGTLADQSDLQSALDAKQDTLPQADGSQDGFLSSEDWTTFNNKLASDGFNAGRVMVTDGGGSIITSPSLQIGAEDGLQAYLSYTPPADSGDIYPRLHSFESEVDPDGISTTQTYVTGMANDIHYDRTGSGGNFGGTFTGTSGSVTHEGSGTMANIVGRSEYLGLGNGSDGSTTQATLNNWNINIQSGHAVGSVTSMNLGINVQGSLNDFYLWNIGGSFSVAGDVYADRWDFQGNIGDDYLGFRRAVNGNVTGDVEMGRLEFNGDADTFQGLTIRATGTITGSSSPFVIDVSGQTSNGGFPTPAMQTNGIVSVGGSIPILSSQTFQSGNLIVPTTTIADGSPVTGTEVLANNFASLLVAEDDMAIGPLGLGWSAIGFVGQLSVASGKVVEEVSMALSGASIPVSSTGGEITTFNLYRGFGAFSAGGTITIPNVNLLKGDNGMCSGASVSCHGLNIQDANASNYVAGELNADGGIRLSTAGAQPTCDSAHRGLMWNVEGGVGVADIFQVCQKDASENYAWVTK